jgi:carboxylesterase
MPNPSIFQAIESAACWCTDSPVRPHHLPDDPRLRFVRLIALFKPYLPKGDRTWFDMQAAEQHVSYDADPTLSYLQLQALLETMRAGLPQVTAPALLIYSQNDPSVTPQDGHMEAIFAALGSQKKDKLLVEKSGHILTNDLERERVRARVYSFVAENSQGPA